MHLQPCREEGGRWGCTVCLSGAVTPQVAWLCRNCFPAVIVCMHKQLFCVWCRVLLAPAWRPPAAVPSLSSNRLIKHPQSSPNTRAPDPVVLFDPTAADAVCCMHRLVPSCAAAVGSLVASYSAAAAAGPAGCRIFRLPMVVPSLLFTILLQMALVGLLWQAAVTGAQTGKLHHYACNQVSNKSC